MSTVAENLAVIKERIRLACVRAGRDPVEVRLVGVTKTVTVERIREGVRAGLTILGENYIQEARQKVEALAGLTVSWHFIGHLQSNKAKTAVECFDWVHTVDRVSLARELDRQAEHLGKSIQILIQVNIGEEGTKSGVAPEELLDLYKSISPMGRLVVRGLMILPPYHHDPERVRPYFRQLHEMLETLKRESVEPGLLTELSMGMSNDFEAAVEEGATFVRIGTSLFGERS